MPTSKLDDLLAFTLPEEGGYSNNPQDPGGATNYGITQATLTTYRQQLDLPPATVGDVKSLTIDSVTPIYGLLFYNPMCCAQLPLGVDLMVFDFGVNAGPARSAKTLQIALGFTGKDVDGSIGPDTIAAAIKDNAEFLIRKLYDLRTTYYEKLPDYAIFGKGWESRNDRCCAEAWDRAGIIASGTTIPTGTTLIMGCRGPLVTALQNALKAKKQYLGYTVDGEFGPHTKDAVAAFQAQNGLYVDGIVGTLTWEKLGFSVGAKR